MTKPEKSYDRDLSYSQWHRTLSDKCYMVDIDGIEVRFHSLERKIVAVIETRDYRASKLPQWRIDTLIDLANGVKAPAFIIRHNCCQQFNGVLSHKNSFRFNILHLQSKTKKTMTETEYRNFLEGSILSFNNDIGFSNAKG